MGKAASRALVGLLGALALLAAYLPWVRAEPLFLRGYQGDGVWFLAGGLLSVTCLLAFLGRPRGRSLAGLALAGGLLAGAVALADLVFLAVGDFVATTGAAADTAAATLAAADGASRAVGGTLTLPADLFALGLFREGRLPAFIAGPERASQAADALLTGLDTLASGPRAGSGLFLALALGVLLSGFACALLMGRPKS